MWASPMPALRPIREPAVAGMFYPDDPVELREVVDALLAAADAPARATCPKALVVPHAGYVYSGPIAASAFALLAPFSDRIERVVLVGPAHRVAVEGLASPGAEAMRTPLGDIAVDLASLERVPQVLSSPVVHSREHSLEVELPFLQRVAPRAQVVPMAVGHATPAEVGRVLEALWGGPETVIVISSDLSHYLPYAVGRERDRSTAAQIVALHPVPLLGEQACGAASLNGLAWVARKRGLTCELLDLRSSGDTAGGRGEVVGYGAFALYEGGES